MLLRSEPNIITPRVPVVNHAAGGAETLECESGRSIRGFYRFSRSYNYV